MTQIAFSVADDPFFKSLRARFYPEVLVMNMKGSIKGRCNPENKKYQKHGKDALYFEDDFREPKLKINDDRRVQINLNALNPKERLGAASKGKTVNNQGSASQLSHHSKATDHPIYNGKMILLTVRVFPGSGAAAPKTGEFDRAWYRLINSDTSQTIDYK